jgi:CRP/FNR family transcriptional regulator/CRP/FNR family cyclic AMP-dependent transcriptional regulator
VTLGAGRWGARSGLERLAASGYGGHTAAVIRHAAAGELIVAQGDEDANMFIVQSGCVEVRRHVGDQVVVHGRLERGDFFGEMSLLESQPRAADVVAVEPTVLVELGAGALLLRIRRDPTLAVEMLQKLSRRIRDLNEGLAGVTTRSDGLVLVEDV